MAFFQYVLSFALQKLPLSALCFQYVLSFVFNVAFAISRDRKSLPFSEPATGGLLLAPATHRPAKFAAPAHEEYRSGGMINSCYLHLAQAKGGLSSMRCALPPNTSTASIQHSVILAYCSHLVKRN